MALCSVQYALLLSASSPSKNSTASTGHPSNATSAIVRLSRKGGAEMIAQQHGHARSPSEPRVSIGSMRQLSVGAGLGSKGSYQCQSARPPVGPA